MHPWIARSLATDCPTPLPPPVTIAIYPLRLGFEPEYEAPRKYFFIPYTAERQIATHNITYKYIILN